VSSGSKAGMPSDRDASMGGGSARSVRRAAHVPCWCESSQTALQAGSEAKGGGITPRRAWLSVKAGRKDRATTVYGDAEVSAEQETLGMCARRLRTVVDVESDQPGVGSSQAGQGAHREVGSEGFAVNHRAVAEQGEPVGQNPGENRAGTMAAKEILGAPGCIKVCAGGTVVQEHALPREVSYGPSPTGMGTWAYKPGGEVAGDAVREVGVTRGTHEPGNNRNPGIVSNERRRTGDSKGVGQGEGVTPGDGELGLQTGE
jgi:hypothetical protein